MFLNKFKFSIIKFSIFFKITKNLRKVNTPKIVTYEVENLYRNVLVDLSDVLAVHLGDTNGQGVLLTLSHDSYDLACLAIWEDPARGCEPRAHYMGTRKHKLDGALVNGEGLHGMGVLVEHLKGGVD